jgi:hypothetical protein
MVTRRGPKDQIPLFDRREDILDGSVAALCATRWAKRDAPRAVVHALMKAIYAAGGRSWRAAAVICWLGIWAGRGWQVAEEIPCWRGQMAASRRGEATLESGA